MGDPQQDDLVNHLLNNLKVPLENNTNMQNVHMHPSVNHGMGLPGMNPMAMNPGMGMAPVPTMAGNGSNMGLAAQSQWEEYLGKYGASEADFVQHFAVLPSPFLYPSTVQQQYGQYYYGGGLYQPMIDPTTLGLYYQQQLQNSSYFGAPTSNPEMGMLQEEPQEMPHPGIAVSNLQPEPQPGPGVAAVAALPPPEDAQKGKPEGRRTWADVMKAPAKPQPPPQPAQPKGAQTTAAAGPATTTAATASTAANATKAKPEQLRTVPLTTKPTQTTADQRKREGKALIQDRVPYTGETINPRDFDVNPRNARFFVIKSYSEDDVHKSIKYAIWASTDSGNRRLDQAYKESGTAGPIYLFFSVNASGQFCGMAQMLSPLDFSKKSDLWAQDKWNGQFLVRWVFIKDIPNSVLRHIRLENNDGKPVTNSRDTQEILLDPGREMLKIFRDYQSKTSILDDLSFYDKRQEMMKDKKEGDKSDKSDGTTTPVSGPSSATTSPSLGPSTPPAAPPTMAAQMNSTSSTGKATKTANATTGKASSNAKPKK